MKTMEMIERIENIFENCTYDPYNLGKELLQDLKADLYKEQTKYTTPERYAAIKKMIANGDKRAAFQKPAHIENSYMLCNGYQFIRFSDDVVFPFATEHLPHIETMQNLHKVATNHCYCHDLELPDYNELKAYIKKEKKRLQDMPKTAGNKYKLVCFDFGANMPRVNAEYLLQMMQVFPNVTRCSFTGKLIDPIYFEQDGENYGILLPVRITEDPATITRTEL